jgi:hypothetical protein
MTLLCKSISASKFKEVKAGYKLAEFSKEAYVSKRAVLPMMMMVFVVSPHTDQNTNFNVDFSFSTSQKSSGR